MIGTLAVLAVLGAIVGAAVAIDRRSDDGGAAVPSDEGDTDLAAAIRGFCADPGPLDVDPAPPAFQPGQVAIAHVSIPRPRSSTEPEGELVLEVSPQVGTPRTELDGLEGLVGLAACFDRPRTERTESTCDYELTTPGSIGDRRSADLVQTTYRGRLFDLGTGEVLAEGEASTPIDACPSFAFVGDDGVSLPLGAEAVLIWLSQRMPEAAAG